MAWTDKTKNTSSFSFQSTSPQVFSRPIGSPIGLLLALTRAADETTSTATPWSDTPKNSSSFTYATKN